MFDRVPGDPAGSPVFADGGDKLVRQKHAAPGRPLGVGAQHPGQSPGDAHV